MIFGLSHIVHGCDYENFEKVDRKLKKHGYYEYFRQENIDNSCVSEFIYHGDNLYSDMVFYKKDKNPSIELVLYEKVAFETPAFEINFGIGDNAVLESKSTIEDMVPMLYCSKAW